MLKNPRGKAPEEYFTSKSKLAKIEAILTSKIELKYQNKQAYYLGFFQLEGIATEIPVIFKLDSSSDNLEKQKPNLPPRAKVLLEGHWAEPSNSPRPSFTCLAFQVISNPPPPTLKSLREQISSLLTISLDKKQEWNQRTDYLFRKQKDLSEIDKLSKLGSEYLSAYLLLRQTHYANYQDNLLPVSPHLTSQEYLNKLASEIEDIACQIRAYQAKEI